MQTYIHTKKNIILSLLLQVLNYMHTKPDVNTILAQMQNSGNESTVKNDANVLVKVFKRRFTFEMNSYIQVLEVTKTIN